MKTKWIIRETDADLSLMSQVLGISPVTANVMANRDLRTKKTALSFLNPSLESAHDGMTIKGMHEALELISYAIEHKEKIMIYGDYDVDGIMATTILLKSLKTLGANVDFYIPHRIEEGYGLNLDAIRQLHKDGAEVLLTVDNGISAIEEIAVAKELGMKVIVLDHHDPGFTETENGREDILPDADVVIDPKQEDCPYPFKELCAGGLAYKLAVSISSHQSDELLALAAIATICDIVSLRDENRIIVKEGLERLNSHKLINLGLGSLITARGYLDKPIDAFAIGFILGPCLNATGRLGSASASVELLIAEDPKDRFRLAEELCRLNDERKKITADCAARALSNLTEHLDKVLVLADTQAHESVAGIVAGRIKEATGRPTIFITQGDNAMKGSGRSIEGYNLFESLFKHRYLFIRFGGHPMAAGLTLSEENIPLLREALNAECNLTEEDFSASLHIDRELSPSEINLKLSEELARLAPYGKGNREPLFVSRSLYVENCRVMNEKNTLIFSFSSAGGRHKGIAFGLNEDYAQACTAAGVKPIGGYGMDVVYAMETNVYNGVASVQMRVRDFKIVP
ncbi:MAG: single-stranded-DNA-specific exonuclease RecJ [Defluviitaleaceae bacterium]|nr:single-stranded-DNA-specific exonuclease RecJ [Defluviitaleaceae bacterium]